MTRGIARGITPLNSSVNHDTLMCHEDLPTALSSCEAKLYLTHSKVQPDQLITKSFSRREKSC